jgi:hypothetical protein
MDPAVVAEVDRRLTSVSFEHGIRIPWAIESGSRAWGFPSPDSDYDCRFLFVRPPADYLDPWPPRDVVETPLDAVFDVRLAVAGNATGAALRGALVAGRRPRARGSRPGQARRAAAEAFRAMVERWS